MTIKPFARGPGYVLLNEHVLDALSRLPAESISCVVTSPPYWSLRKYDAPDVDWNGWRGQYGLEPTPDLYIEHTLDVLRSIRRVLRPDGVVWWNIGDGYAAGGSGQQGNTDKGSTLSAGKSGDGQWGSINTTRNPASIGLKPKDLVLMPFRVALAAQADGWYVRSVVIWNKPNAMPESVRDRPTTSHEYVLLLTKNARYWWDQEAVRGSASDASIARISQETFSEQSGGPKDYAHGTNPNRSARKAIENFAANPGRNLRSVWEFPTAQTPEAHFATFPEELPARCIKASCPPEVCAKCGTARERVLERTSTGKSYAVGKSAAKRDDGLATAFSGYDDGSSAPTFETKGWTSCACDEPDYRPGLVLDPFCGMGTTGVAAKRLGRRFVGIELSEEYIRLARNKLEMGGRKGRADVSRVKSKAEEGRGRGRTPLFGE